MRIYKLGSGITENKELFDKLVAQCPGQAQSILNAIWEISGGEAKNVGEDAIMSHISTNLERLAPTAKDPSVVKGFVAYYRAMLAKFPKHLLEVTGGGERVGAVRAKAGPLLDPVTGEPLENMFVRTKTKNPGIRAKAQRIKDIAEEMEVEANIGDEPGDELEEEATNEVSNM